MVMQLPAAVEHGQKRLMAVQMADREIKKWVSGIKADLKVAVSLFHGGTAISADLCD